MGNIFAKGDYDDLLLKLDSLSENYIAQTHKLTELEKKHQELIVVNKKLKKEIEDLKLLEQEDYLFLFDHNIA